MQADQAKGRSPAHVPAAPLPHEPATCYPSRPDHVCFSCARLRFGDPVPVSQRQSPVIDASVSRFHGECGMFKLSVVSVREVVSRASSLEQAWRAQA